MLTSAFGTLKVGSQLRFGCSTVASKARFGPVHGDRIKVFVTSPPVDGAANQAVVELIAKCLGQAKRHVEVVSGQSSRRKTVRVMGSTRAAVLSCLE